MLGELTCLTEQSNKVQKVERGSQMWQKIHIKGHFSIFTQSSRITSTHYSTMTTRPKLSDYALAEPQSSLTV